MKQKILALEASVTILQERLRREENSLASALIECQGLKRRLLAANEAAIGAAKGVLELLEVNG